jgi:hypothetical protein
MAVNGGTILTGVITWADGRAVEQARAVAARRPERALS